MTPLARFAMIVLVSMMIGAGLALLSFLNWRAQLVYDAVLPWGITQRLPRKIGAARATRLMMTGESISAQDMERAGLVSRCVPAAALAETAQALTETLAAKSPLGLARMKELEEENRRLRKMYVEEKLKAEVVSEALAKKW
mgnify:CR=1 FL=1